MIPEGDSSAMAEKLAVLLGDNDLFQKMGAFGAEYAKAHFDAELMTETYLNLYREIIFETDRK